MSKCFVHREGTDVDAADKDGCTPLLVAARQGCSEAFAKLLEKADFEKRAAEYEGTALLLAARADHSAILEVSYTLIILVHCDLSLSLQIAKRKYPDFFRQGGGDEETPLHAAAANGSEKSLQILLCQRVNVNARGGRSQQTPLHMAAQNGHDM